MSSLKSSSSADRKISISVSQVGKASPVSPISPKPSSEIPFDSLSEFAEIGQGSFGKVFRADFVGTDVAVKEFFRSIPDQQPGWELEKYFGREVDMMREARHPNIVQFMGTCVQQGRVYLVTEFVPGGNLKQWIMEEREALFGGGPDWSSNQAPSDRNGRDMKGSDGSKSSPPSTLFHAGRLVDAAVGSPPGSEAELSSHSGENHLLSFRNRISFAIDIARAIAYLHTRGILHRDLKLENLLLTENNRVKVCDFGFSRLAARNEQERRRLSFLGTDSYMAPELILCLGDYDKSVDIFAFGIILLALCCLLVPEGNGPSDEPPFRRVIPGFGLDPAAIQGAVLQNLPNRSTIIELIEKCVEYDMVKRANMKEILATLKETEHLIIKAVRAENLKTGRPRDIVDPTVVNVGTLHRKNGLRPSYKSGQESSLSVNNSQADIWSAPLHGQSHRGLKELSECTLSEGQSNTSGLATAANDKQACLTKPTPMFRTSLSTKDPIVESATPMSAPESQSQISSSASPNSLHRSLPRPKGLNMVASNPRLRHDIPHRFSIVFSAISLHGIQCDVCSKPVQSFMHTHLECDDCGYRCHKKVRRGTLR